MANNGFRPMYSSPLHGSYVELNTKDIAVGDKLVHVSKHGGSWNSPVIRREEVVTVTKVLASRLVVENENGTTFRVLVQNSKSWPTGNGRVGTDIEGYSTSYRRSAFLLYTLDDPFLIADRESTKDHNARTQTRQTAGRAAEAAWRNLNIQTAEAAIVALQAYILANKED